MAEMSATDSANHLCGPRGSYSLSSWMARGGAPSVALISLSVHSCKTPAACCVVFFHAVCMPSGGGFVLEDGTIGAPTSELSAP